MTAFDSTPPEVIIEGIFSYVHPIELWQCRKVCRAWKRWIGLYFRSVRWLDFSDSFSEYCLNAEGFRLIVKSLHMLRGLNLGRCFHCATESTLTSLTVGCHSLEVLSVPFCREVTDNVLAAIAENCPHTRELNFNRCFKISEHGLKSIAKNCKQLRKLSVSRCYGVTDKGVTALVQGCPLLTELDIGWCYKYDLVPSTIILELESACILCGSEVMRWLPPLPTIADIIRLYGLTARSQLSQNFLLNLSVTDRLVRLAGCLEGCCVCEVGPGPGALTRSVLNAGPRKVVVVEKDRRFLPSLELLRDASDGCLEVHHGDALDFDTEKLCGPHVDRRAWEDEPPNLHIVGNLPFNVSIPLLLQWLSMIPQRKGPFSFGRTQLTLTFQKEVGERIKAPPCDAQRSRLSIMAQHLCHIQQGFIIRGQTFVPPPKVDAVVLKLIPLVKPRIEVEYGVLEILVKSLFQYRRKYIRKGASLLFPNHPKVVPELFRLSGVDDTLRAQQLTLEQFQQLCNAYTELLTNKISDENKAPEHTQMKCTSVIVDG